MNQAYHIRAEFPDNKYEDFKVNAESLAQAQEKAETRIMEGVGRMGQHIAPALEWRGAVVFVNRKP